MVAMDPERQRVTCRNLSKFMDKKLAEIRRLESELERIEAEINRQQQELTNIPGLFNQMPHRNRIADFEGTKSAVKEKIRMEKSQFSDLRNDFSFSGCRGF